MKRYSLGAVHLLLLMVVAVTLIGVVGYVSVKRITSMPKSEVLSESDDLDAIEELDLDLPELPTESPKARPEVESEDEFESEAGELSQIEELETNLPEIELKSDDQRIVKNEPFLINFFKQLLARLNIQL